ncbi:MAG TPA: hypothetical protein PLL10_01775 [Elusimicrobiales bacterium]|nr:hypothetical protein [Elusimicrobiales bacterium]
MASCRYFCNGCGRWFEFELGTGEKPQDTLDCPFCDTGKALLRPQDCPSPKTGSYKYNKKLRRLIKVSDAVPGLSGGGSGGGCAGCAGGNCSTCGH